MVAILLASCTITDSEGVSANELRRGFGGSSPPTVDAARGGASSAPSVGGSAASKLDQSLARAAATTPEPGDDALHLGNTPPYAEITAAAIQGQGRSLQFTLTFADSLPETMPDANTTMSAGYRFRIGDVPYVLTASASTDGWRLAATKDGKTADSGGTLRVAGNALTITIPWSFLRGPRAFNWTGYLAWNQSSTVRSYVVDIVPNAGEAPFPSA